MAHTDHWKSENLIEEAIPTRHTLAVARS